MNQTMRMICDRVVCKGGGKIDFANQGKKITRLLPFPDGMSRLVSMSVNDWSLFDRHYKIASHRYFTSAATILRHAPLCAEAHGWPIERAIQYIFRLGMIGIARKLEYGGDHPANDEEWADAMCRALFDRSQHERLSSVFARHAVVRSV